MYRERERERERWRRKKNREIRIEKGQTAEQAGKEEGSRK
jgi:hypothetical protein